MNDELENQLAVRLKHLVDDAKDTRRAIAKSQAGGIVHKCACGAWTVGLVCSACARKQRDSERNGEP